MTTTTPLLLGYIVLQTMPATDRATQLASITAALKALQDLLARLVGGE